MHVYVYVSMFACVHVYLWFSLCVSTFACMCVCARLCVYIFLCVCVCMRMYTYISLTVCVHVSVFVLLVC